MYIIKHSVSKMYSIRYKKSFLFNFGCGDFKVLF